MNGNNNKMAINKGSLLSEAHKSIATEKGKFNLLVLPDSPIAKTKGISKNEKKIQSEIKKDDSRIIEEK